MSIASELSLTAMCDTLKPDFLNLGKDGKFEYKNGGFRASLLTLCCTKVLSKLTAKIQGRRVLSPDEALESPGRPRWHQG
jgi:hypothetical protein